MILLQRADNSLERYNTFMTDLQILQERIKRFHNERLWSHHPKEIAIDIALEAAELLEHFKWRNGEALDIYIKEHEEDIKDELSDVIHAALLLSQAMHIDIHDAFEHKMKKNEIKYPIST